MHNQFPRSWRENNKIQCTSINKKLLSCGETMFHKQRVLYQVVYVVHKQVCLQCLFRPANWEERENMMTKLSRYFSDTVLQNIIVPHQIRARITPPLRKNVLIFGLSSLFSQFRIRSALPRNRTLICWALVMHL